LDRYDFELLAGVEAQQTVFDPMGHRKDAGAAAYRMARLLQLRAQGLVSFTAPAHEPQMMIPATCRLTPRGQAKLASYRHARSIS
jgi:hypothetical protein